MAPLHFQIPLRIRAIRFENRPSSGLARRTITFCLNSLLYPNSSSPGFFRRTENGLFVAERLARLFTTIWSKSRPYKLSPCWYRSLISQNSTFDQSGNPHINLPEPRRLNQAPITSVGSLLSGIFLLLPVINTNDCYIIIMVQAFSNFAWSALEVRSGFSWMGRLDLESWKCNLSRKWPSQQPITPDSEYLIASWRRG